MSIDLDAIRARADAATPGPWKSTDHYPHVVFQGGEENIVSTNLAGDPLADGAFIAHARQDIPALLAEVDRAGNAGYINGYREAVALLRDDDRYRDWWTSDRIRPDGRIRHHLADYLATVGPPVPVAAQPPVEAGVAWLDEHAPDWWRALAPGTVPFTHWIYGKGHLWHYAYGELKVPYLRPERRVELGFDPKDVWSIQDYNDLSDQWAWVLRERHAAPAAPVAAHHQTAGWVGGPGECGVECACGTTFDGFDTIAEAAALLDDHIAAAGTR